MSEEGKCKICEQRAEQLEGLHEVTEALVGMLVDMQEDQIWKDIMTASREEAANIVAVMLRYMPFKTAQHIALELEHNVSTYSNNESLRETIDLLKQFLSADNND